MNKTTHTNFSRFLTAILVVTGSLIGTSAFAQDNPLGDENPFPNFSLGGFGKATTDDPATWKAEYFVDESTSQGRLDVSARVAKGWHVYSTTQPPGGPLPTKLAIEEPDNVKVAGDFVPSEPPLKSISAIFKGVTMEEHEGIVVWSAPILVPEGFRNSITVSVDAQVCKDDGACVPVEERLTATFAGTIGAATVMQTDASNKASSVAAPQQTFRDEDYQVEWSGRIVPSTAEPGSQAMLTLTATPDPKYHVYHSVLDDSKMATNLVITDKGGLKLGPPKPSTEPVSTKLMPDIFFHEGQVAWTIPIQIPESAKPGEHQIKGMIGYQACTETSCQMPMALSFTTTLTVGQPTATSPQLATVIMSPTDYKDALDAAATTKWVDDIPTQPIQKPKTETEKPPVKVQPAEQISVHPSEAEVDAKTAESVEPIVINADDEKESMSFPWVLTFAFLGGVILNVMPCVLPVVGLKVMSFVQQAGQDRKRIFLLNFVYAAGIVFVFAILASLAVVLKFSWGEQFTFLWFRLGLTILMFAMALSYLGVWEIPMPGMASGKASQELQQREGYTGAFFKGVFATVLATPCSGPLLGWILGLTFSLTSMQTTSVIMVVGVGMALPYLIIGIWPALVSWLPKPGDWMVTLKEFLAFLFLATVAFFFNQFSDVHKVPVFVTLIGVWFACWLIGKVPNWADLHRRIIAWSFGITIASVIGMAAFHYLGAPPVLEPGQKAIAWEPYDEERLQQLHDQGQTVLIDFTAKWCPNCIWNYKWAINTEPTRELIEKLNAVPMLADWTDRDAKIKAKLEELESRSIPVLAIYPGTRPNQPIVLRDIVTQSAVLDALRQAGPSKSGESISRVASASH